MIYDWKMGIYWRLPVRLQESILSAYARFLETKYYGSLYQEWKEKFHSWKNWPLATIEEWQDQQLRNTIELAFTKVPYYENLHDRVPWKRIHSKNDLHLIPILEKQSIRNNESSFIDGDQDPRSLWVEKTSGTTGTSLRIYWPLMMVSQWAAIIEVMVRSVAGVVQEMPRAMMGGRPIIPGNTEKPPYWRFNRRWRQLYLSSYHVSKRTSPDYIKALKKFESSWMTGYGSVISALTENALNEGIDSLPLRSVITSGDTLLPGMRNSIETFFQCKCFDHYGQCEGVAMAMECKYGRMHIIPYFGIVEILREDATPCKHGEVGEIVATSLLNNAMPLIRYRTGDYAAFAENQSCDCGNPNVIISNLVGRIDDYLVTVDGRKIGRLSTAFKRSSSIHSAQLLQDRPGHAFLLVRPGDGYRSSHALTVRDDIVEKIGKFNLEIIEVAEIPKTIRGKSVLVIRLDEHPAMKDIYKQIIGKEIS